jgi:hypothetical protein
LSYILFRMMMMLDEMTPPRVIPYLSMAYAFMHDQLQKHPVVLNLFRNSSYL